MNGLEIEQAIEKIITDLQSKALPQDTAKQLDAYPKTEDKKAIRAKMEGLHLATVSFDGYIDKFTLTEKGWNFTTFKDRDQDIADERTLRRLNIYSIRVTRNIALGALTVALISVITTIVIFRIEKDEIKKTETVIPQLEQVIPSLRQLEESVSKLEKTYQSKDTAIMKIVK